MDSHYKQQRPCIPADIKRGALIEAGHKCSIPGCNEHTYLEAHHINGNREDNRLENLIILCDKHHKMAHGTIIDRKSLREYKRLNTEKSARNLYDYKSLAETALASDQKLQQIDDTLERIISLLENNNTKNYPNQTKDHISSSNNLRTRKWIFTEAMREEALRGILKNLFFTCVESEITGIKPDWTSYVKISNQISYYLIAPLFFENDLVDELLVLEFSENLLFIIDSVAYFFINENSNAHLKTIRVARAKFKENKPPMPRENAPVLEFKEYFELTKPLRDKRDKLIKHALKKTKDSFNFVALTLIYRCFHLLSRCKSHYDRALLLALSTSKVISSSLLTNHYNFEMQYELDGVLIDFAFQIDDAKLAILIGDKGYDQFLSDDQVAKEWFQKRGWRFIHISTNELNVDLRNCANMIENKFPELRYLNK